MLVFQFRSSLWTCALVRSAADANRTVGISRWMALRSSQVRVGSVPDPPNAPDCLLAPDITTSMFEPIDENVLWTTACAPSPTATIAMTAKTPITIPSIVRNERSLLRRSACHAMRIVCVQVIVR